MIWEIYGIVNKVAGSIESGQPSGVIWWYRRGDEKNSLSLYQMNKILKLFGNVSSLVWIQTNAIMMWFALCSIRFFSLSLFFCIVIRLVIFTGVYAFTIQMDIKPFAADNNENQTNSLERNHLNAHFSFHCAPHLAPVLLYTQEMRFKFYLMLAYSAKVKFSKLFRTMRGVAVAAIFLSTFFSFFFFSP